MRGTCDSFNQQLQLMLCTSIYVYVYTGVSIYVYAHLYTGGLTHMSYVYICIYTIKLCKALVPFPFFE